MSYVDWPQLARFGFSFFPLRPQSKRPAMAWQEFQGRRPTPEEVARWAQWPQANAGIATGAISGVIVLDTDSDEAEAEVHRRGIPSTPAVKTAKGRHYYFRHPGGKVSNFAGRLPGCDLRGDGGYVVAAGSVHETGVVYEWETSPDSVPFAALPPWLVDLISAPAAPSAAPAPHAPNAYAEAALDKELASLRRASEGARNNSLNTAAYNLGQLVGAGALGRGQVETLLLAVAKSIGLDEREAAATVKSGLDGGIAAPRRMPEPDHRHRRPPDAGAGPRDTDRRSPSQGGAVTNLAEERHKRRQEQPQTSLQHIDPITWDGQDIPPRQWVVEDWIPSKTVTALYGDGGLGKSLVAQQLLTAAALGRGWLGLPVKPCRAMGFFCEDPTDELHRRQADINRLYEASMVDLEDVRLFSRPAEDNLLMMFDADGRGKTTPLYGQLLNAAKDFGAQILVIDTAADVFGGNENVRNQVRQFIAALTHIAMEIDGAVLLCAHPSVSGMSSGSGFAGSTAWSNSVRSRLYLERPAQEEGAPQNPNERVLSRKKANYAASGDVLPLTWEAGILKPLHPQGGMVAAIDRNSAEAAFLEGLQALTTQGRHVSDSLQAHSYAPKAIKQTIHGQRFTVKDLQGAMARLFDRGLIRMTEGRPRRLVIMQGCS